METVRLAVCALCLKMAHFSKREPPEETLVMLEMLNVSNLNLSEVEDPTVCSICVEKLKGAFNFKTACLKGEKSRISKAIQIIDNVLCENLVECRLCNNCVTRNSAVLLSERLKQDNMFAAFQKYVPEIDLDATGNPVICEHCQTLLSRFGTFVSLLSHGDVRDKTKDILQSSNIKDPTPVESDILKAKATKDEIEKKSTHYSSLYKEVNKSGVIEVKTEISEESESKNVVVNINKDDISDKICVQNKTETASDNAVSEDRIIGIKVGNGAINEYVNVNSGTVNADIKKALPKEYTEYQLKHEEINIKSEPEEYMNEWNCAEAILAQNTDPRDQKLIYEVNYQQYNDQTLSKGNNTDEVKWIKCLKCTYRTAVHQGLKEHMLIHKNAVKIDLYKCPECSYQSKYKQNIKSHIITHKNSNEVKMHKCSQCTYQTKFKHNLKSHIIIHKNANEVEMHKCPHCSYQSKFKYNLKPHIRIHKNSNEVEMHKWFQCNYKTKFKQS